MAHDAMCRLRRESDQCCVVIRRVRGTVADATQATVAAAPFLAVAHGLNGELVERNVVNEWLQRHNFEYVGLPSAPQLAQLIDR